MLNRLADTEERRALLEEGGGHTEIFGPDGIRLRSTTLR